MRRFYGAVLGLLSAAFLVLAYAQMARASWGPLSVPKDAATPPDCKSALAKKIVELLSDDAGGAKDGTTLLELQYELTLYKLASLTTANGNKTIEAMVGKETAGLQDRLAKMQDTDKKGVMDKLLALYKPEKADEEAQAAQRVDEVLKKFSTGAYSKLDARFKNRELAAFVIAHQKLKGDQSPFDEKDQAILWLQSTLSEGLEAKFGRGSAEANLSETSSQIIRLTGIIGTASTAVELKKKVDETEIAVAAEFKRIEDKYSEELKASCAGCASCGTGQRISPSDRVQALAAAVTEVQTKMKDPAYRMKIKVDQVFGAAKKRGVTVSLDLGSKETSEGVKKKDQQDDDDDDDQEEENGTQATPSESTNAFQKGSASQMSPDLQKDSSKANDSDTTNPYFDWGKTDRLNLPSDTIFHSPNDTTPPKPDTLNLDKTVPR